MAGIGPSPPANSSRVEVERLKTLRKDENGMQKTGRKGVLLSRTYQNCSKLKESSVDANHKSHESKKNH